MATQVDKNIYETKSSQLKNRFDTEIYNQYQNRSIFFRNLYQYQAITEDQILLYYTAIMCFIFFHFFY